MRLITQTIALVLFNIQIAVRCDKLEDLFANCRISKPDFEECLKFTFNQLNPLFKYGLPEYGVAPFDPHKQSYVEQIRGDQSRIGGYKLVLNDVSEFGWTQSNITKLHMNWNDNELVYSQDFPLKSLEGKYKFNSKILGNIPIKNSGNFTLVLKKYSQTTTVKRLGGPGSRLKVKVHVDKIGGMELHIGNLLGGRTVFESVADFAINIFWAPSLPLILPLVNDLVSTAFTDIFNESFRYFPIDKIIKY